MRSPVQSVSAPSSALLACLCGAAPVSAQTAPDPAPVAPFQFRVNATDGETWGGGLAQASVAVKPTGFCQRTSEAGH